MNEPHLFTGVYTALVTPFDQTGAVDYDCLRRLVEWQIAEGVQGLVAVGTTGESPTLSTEEHVRVIAETAAAAKGRVRVLAGTGANSTAEAVELTRAVLDLGVAGTLQVTPYYNKPSAEGLYRHFCTVADLGLPVMLYNVPGRAGREIPLGVVERLAKHPLVTSIKEAAGNVERVSAIRGVCDLCVLSGDDALALPMISVGAQGVVSVASNVVPGPMAELVRRALKGDFAGALALHERFYPLFRDLFIETNPIPVKTALALMGRTEPVFRLPLCELSGAPLAQLRATLAACGVAG